MGRRPAVSIPADHGLDLTQATLIGDKPSDLGAARAVGAGLSRRSA